jgi:hypothetical protein
MLILTKQQKSLMRVILYYRIISKVLQVGLIIKNNERRLHSTFFLNDALGDGEISADVIRWGKDKKRAKRKEKKCERKRRKQERKGKINFNRVKYIH